MLSVKMLFLLNFVTKYFDFVIFFQKKYFIYIRENKRKYIMSFDVNVLRTKPIIREAANMNNDGGGGNLGYLPQGQQEGKDKRKKLDESIFGKKEEDLFLGKADLNFEEEFSIVKWVSDVFESFLRILKLK